MTGHHHEMAVNLRGVTTVLLPGTGSDDDYVYRAFSAALHDVGAVVVTPAPAPDRLIDGHAVAVLAALPAWTGAPDTAPAAQAARHSAHLLRRDGLAAATTAMRASSPKWLADELTRSWVGQWPSLPDAMDEAARYIAPTCPELEGLTVPMGIASATDDPVHPVEVGIEWAAAAPRAALRTVTLDEMGADPAVLGAACLAALADTS
jgi:pimeloyl-ACP methyl ester carboxylesterase